MKTLIISGDTPLPAELLDLVRRGSTSLLEHRAADFESRAATLEVDRIVVWTAAGDETTRGIAARYVRAEAAERREVVVFVTPERDAAQPPAGLPPNEFFVWPRDEDRLKMAFLTGA